MKNINNLFIFFVYDRPTVLKKCLETFFAGIKNQDFTKGSRSKFIFLLDGPNYTTEEVFLNFIADNGIEEKYEIEIINTENRGYSYRFFEALNLAILYSPKFLGFIECDYFYSPLFMDTIQKALKSTKALAVSGFSHPDFMNPAKSIKWFGNSVKEQNNGKDVINRNNLYKPFIINDLELQYGTHSCMTLFILWRQFIEEVNLAGRINELYTTFDKVCERETNFVPSTPSDGWLCGFMSLVHSEINNFNKYTKESMFVDIISPPISCHLEGAGINGSSIPEGYTNCLPIKWNKDWFNL